MEPKVDVREGGLTSESVEGGSKTWTSCGEVKLESEEPLSGLVEFRFSPDIDSGVTPGGRSGIGKEKAKGNGGGGGISSNGGGGEAGGISA